MVSCVLEVDHADLFIDKVTGGIDIEDTESVICVLHVGFSNSTDSNIPLSISQNCGVFQQKVTRDL